MRLPQLITTLSIALLILTGCTFSPSAQNAESNPSPSLAEDTQPTPPTEDTPQKSPAEENRPTPLPDEPEEPETAPLTEAFYRCDVIEDYIEYRQEFEDGQCAILPPLEINHPSYGETSFALGVTAEGDGVRNTYWLLDDQGEVIERRLGEVDGTWFLGAPQLDDSGNIIYMYNPGRSDGCVALRPEGEWFEGFETDPLQVSDPKSDYDTRFYGCKWVEGESGSMDIVYIPSGGATFNPNPEVFTWNGEDYEKVDEESVED